eukprot:7594797-Alexandrium_andersonii.AAC.1
MINHFRAGPRRNSKLSRASYIQFIDSDDRNRFLATAGGKGTKFEIQGLTQRDWGIAQSHRYVEGVKVGDAVAFSQEQSSLSGSLLPHTVTVRAKPDLRH